MARDIGQTLNVLKIVRGGGHPWTKGEIEERLRGLGFALIESFSVAPPIVHVVGRKPLGGMSPRHDNGSGPNTLGSDVVARVYSGRPDSRKPSMCFSTPLGLWRK